MPITLHEARGIFTTAYLQKFKEMIPVPSFLRSFFNTETSAAKQLSIDVQRGTEFIASDVLRGTGGNRNMFSRSSERMYVPPFFSEYFDATALDRYDVLFGQNPSLVPKTIGYLAKDVAEKLVILRNKMDRAKELQCSQVFETGIVTMDNGDNIDYKRKAGSKVDPGAGNYWDTVATDVEAQLVASAEFIRNTGKNGVPILNLVISGKAWVALKKTNYFTNNANYQQVRLIDINMPQKSSFGAGYHGQITAGAYIFNVWTYDEVYQAKSTGTITRYIPLDQAIILPTAGAVFTLAHAGVPAILVDKGKAEYSKYIVSQASEYWVNNYIDPQRKAHIFEMSTAPLAIPVTVDMIYTLKNLT